MIHYIWDILKVEIFINNIVSLWGSISLHFQISSEFYEESLGASLKKIYPSLIFLIIYRSYFSSIWISEIFLKIINYVSEMTPVKHFLLCPEK